MNEYVEAFTLGNAAILSNVCLLPLYPGMIVLLANQAGGNGTAGRPGPNGGTTSDGGRSRWARLLGVAVLAGVVVFMCALGFVLHRAHRSVADILDWFLPLMLLAVAALGIAMIAGWNPFARVAVAQAPILRNPAATAFLYGMFLAPMTLPCTGPLVVSAFVIGSVAGSGALVDWLAYFASFAVGFGWPLVVLPFFAVPLQRRAVRFLGAHHRKIEVLSGALLVAVAIFGAVTDLGANS